MLNFQRAAGCVSFIAYRYLAPLHEIRYKFTAPALVCFFHLVLACSRRQLLSLKKKSSFSFEKLLLHFQKNHFIA